MRLISAVLLVYAVCLDGAYLYEGGNENPEVYKEKRAYDLSLPHLPSIQETCERAVQDCNIKMRPFTTKKMEDVMSSLRQTGIRPICTAAGESIKCLQKISKSDLCFNMVGVETIKEEVGKALELHNIYCDQLADEIEANKECILNWNLYTKLLICFNEQTIPTDPCNSSFVESCVNSATADTAGCQSEAKDILMQALTPYKNEIEIKCSGTTNVFNFFRNLML